VTIEQLPGLIVVGVAPFAAHLSASRQALSFSTRRFGA
jgi:hypothetical protein